MDSCSVCKQPIVDIEARRNAFGRPRHLNAAALCVPRLLGELDYRDRKIAELKARITLFEDLEYNARQNPRIAEALKYSLEQLQ